MNSTKRSETQRRKGAKIIPQLSFASLRLCAQNSLLVLCTSIFLVGCNSNDTTNTNTPVISAPPSTALPMPPVNGISLSDMGWEMRNGKRSVISDYKGNVLVLDFYATWCVPCRDSVPHLIGLQKKFGDQGLRVVGLNVGGPGDELAVPAFAKEFGIQYTLATPDEDLVSLLLSGNDVIPQTFVFDRQGQLVRHLIGFDSTSGEVIDRAVETALKTEAP